MKALTLTQPWATLVAIGAKCIETRSWSTRYRGPVAIHAAKHTPPDALALKGQEPFASALVDQHPLPTSAIIAVADLTNCYRFDEGTLAAVIRGSRRELWPPNEADFGDFSAGRYGLALGNVRRLPEPIIVRGMLGLWEVAPDVAAAIANQLEPEVLAV